MKTENYIGKQLLSLAKCTNIHYRGYCVFMLRDADDTTGVRIAEDFSIRGVLRQHPEVSRAVVKYANDFCGQIVLRVWFPIE